MKVRNFAIIAHVDHGKTTLVDALLKQAGVFRENQHVAERVMDNNDLERERGITILSKNLSYEYLGTKFNVVDTPGHADFGGEVERVLGMVDGVLLLVDAAEGPLPQTRFVLKNSLERGIKPIVLINKIDRADQRAHQVHEEVLDLFLALGATDEQADFPCLYACAREGWAVADPDDPKTDNLKLLLDMLAAEIPEPSIDTKGPLQMQVASISYDNFVGRSGIGRVKRGVIRKNEQMTLHTTDGKMLTLKPTKVITFKGTEAVEVDEVEAGDIAGVAGFEDIMIGDTFCDPQNPDPLPALKVDEPTLSMTFGVNTSPFAGREGKYVTSRHLKARLEKELLSNLALRVEPTDTTERFRVSGRGELHLGILIETMRREGYELEIGKPQVILKDEEGKKMEPYENIILDLPEDSVGGVMEALGSRGGKMLDMQPFGTGRQRLEYSIASRRLLGFRTDYMTLTRGEGILHQVFDKYGDFTGGTSNRNRGVVWAMEKGVTTGYAISLTQERSVIFVDPGTEVYVGMIIGENSRDVDMGVNICKKKQMSNMRSSGADDALNITPPKKMSLEQCLEYIEDDELVEITPVSFRLRKKILDPALRKRSEKAASGK